MTTKKNVSRSPGRRKPRMRDGEREVHFALLAEKLLKEYLRELGGKSAERAFGYTARNPERLPPGTRAALALASRSLALVEKLHNIETLDAQMYASQATIAEELAKLESSACGVPLPPELETELSALRHEIADSQRSHAELRRSFAGWTKRRDVTVERINRALETLAGADVLALNQLAVKALIDGFARFERDVAPTVKRRDIEGERAMRLLTCVVHMRGLARVLPEPDELNPKIFAAVKAAADTSRGRGHRKERQKLDALNDLMRVLGLSEASGESLRRSLNRAEKKYGASLPVFLVL